MKNVIKLFILTLVLSIGAFAQIHPIDETGETTQISLSGLETRVGKFDIELQQTIGNSFVVSQSSRRDSSALLTIEFDYHGDAGFPSGNRISRGSWNLAVYHSEGGYRGSIFGEVTSGNISWYSATDLSVGDGRITNAVLLVTGGSGEFEEHPIDGELYFDANTNTETKATDATLKGLLY